MNSRTRQAKGIAVMLLCTVLLTGCQTFRPMGYQPPKDSYEYVMQRDRPASKEELESREPWWGGLIKGLLQWAAYASNR